MRVVSEAQVVVVGGGPVGLAAAIAARRRGLDVLVVDGQRPLIDKPCGEGLMPEGISTLSMLGVRIDISETLPFRGVRYLDNGIVAEARFSKGVGFGIRRPVLQGALVQRAEEMGVRLSWGVKVTGLLDGGVKTDRGPVACRWIVGADGLHSRVRQWARLDREPGKLRRYGVRRHYLVKPWTDLVEVYWSERCEAYVTPVGRQEVGVAMLWSGEKAGFDEHLSKFPNLRRRLAGATVNSQDRGAGPFHQRAMAVHRGSVALVGDAAGYVDALTGDGLAIGFHQAVALADALVADDLQGYAQAWREATRLPFLMTRLLLVAERRPQLRSRLIRALARDQEMFRRLLNLQVRARSFSDFGVALPLRLVRGLVA